MSGACVFCIIMNKLGYWQDPCPVILLEVDKDLKIPLHGIVLPLDLSVYLRIEGGRKLLLDTKEVVER